MDFWSKLIGGTGSNRTVSKGPDERLIAFKRACGILQQIYRAGVPLSEDENACSNTRACLERMNIILTEESRAPVPHPCLSFATASRIYVHATRLAVTSFDIDLVRSTTVFLSALIDNEEDIVANQTFARALVNLANRGVGSQSLGLGEEEDAYLVELLFGVANKIRMQPDILPAWFAPSSTGQNKDPETEGEFVITVRREDFLLFYLLLDNVYHDGRAGDFARTGLLYIIETASESRDLERWLIESDLATLMASGLGAMYSQLSRKLSFRSFGGPKSALITLSDPDAEHDETNGHSELQSHMDAFLSYLMFWQDTLEHCKSTEVKDTLLDHFQVLFLQQLLYPSLLESSDVDGGSTFSVLTYLSCILDAVDHPDLIRRILEYLLASPPHSGLQKPKTPRHRMSMSRRKSFDLLTAMAQSDEDISPTLFNLVDLISMSLRSKNKNTVAAVLKLVSVILRKHHQYALNSLFKSEPRINTSRRTLSDFDESIMDFFFMASTIDENEPLDESYEAYLKDASILLESHPCSAPLLHFKTFALPDVDLQVSDGTGNACDATLMIQPDDKVFLEILALMESFFKNDVITNLSLTETFVNLASCGFVHLEGWLLVEALQQLHSEAQDPECKAIELSDEPPLQQSSSIESSPRMGPSNSTGPAPRPTPSTTPLLSILERHIAQIQRWRDEVSNFDDVLAMRRRQLQGSAPAEDFPSRSASAQSPEPSKPGESPTLTSFGDALSPQRTLRIQSRSRSPRGRKFRSINSSTSTSEVNSTAPSRSPVPRGARVRSPWASPLREASNVYDQTDLHDPDATDKAEEHRVSEALHRNIALRLPPASRIALGGEAADADSSSVGSAPTDSGKLEETEQRVEVSLSHILTNVIILREFILELAAVVQVRAGLFGAVL